MIDDPRDDEAFANRIAKPLRAPERVDATFEARAMSAVYAEARAAVASDGRRSWWRRPRMVLVSPLSLALAAGFAALVFGGFLALDNRRPDATVAAHTDTVQVVRFVLVDAAARRVALVGTFNQWQKDAMFLTRGAADGVWTLDAVLPPGRHEYAFIVFDERGERWVADPLTERVRDDYGTETSIVSVGARSSS